MGFTIDIIIFMVGLFVFFLWMGFQKKNAFFILLSGIMSIIIALMIWTGGIVAETGSIVSGNLTGTTIQLSQSAQYTTVNFGFSQHYLALTFVLLGLFFFLLGIGAFSAEQGGKM